MMRDPMRPILTVLTLLASGCAVSENPEFCEDHGACAGNPAGSFCHPTRHYCHRGCSSDQECQDPMTRAYLGADKPVCGVTTHECHAALTTSDAGPAASLDAGPAPDGIPLPDASQAKRQPGASCAAPAECASGFCADGVCCDGACDGSCVACDLPGAAGVCTPVAAGEDPAKECAGSGPCSGSCDGQGACSFASSAGKSCAGPSCAAGALTTSACDEQGACVASSQACGGYACVGATSCKTSCASSADCTGGSQCVASKCVSQFPLGAACGSNDDACSSKQCTDGACCKVASCGGVCKQCGAGGLCLPANEGKSCGPASCTGSAASGAQQTLPQCKAGACASSTSSCGDYLCDAAGAGCLAACGSDSGCRASAYCGGAKCLPRKPLGAACGTSKECQGGACVDGVCCDSLCTGSCMSCKLAGSVGKCSPVPDGQNPDGECAGTVAACSGSCDGKGACKYPGSTTSCKAPSCSGYMFSQAFCYKGGCIDYGESCDGDYLCASSTACGTSCTGNSQCTSGHCDLGDLYPGRKHTCAKLTEICHVDAKACPGTGTGSSAAPFCRIQSCLDEEKPYVLVADGTYPENLTVKANVQLLATGSGAPLVDPRTGAVKNLAIKVEIVPQAAGAGILIEDVGKVLLRGLRVTHHNAPSVAAGDLVKAALLSASPMEVRIESCDLWEARGCVSRGLKISSTNDAALKVAVTDSVASASATGVEIAGATSGASPPQLALKQVVLTWNSTQALSVWNAAATVTDAFIAFNPGLGVRAHAAQLAVERAKIGVNGGGGLLLDFTRAVITNTLVNDNGAEGIRLTGSGTLLSGENLRLVNVTAANNKNAELACAAWSNGTGRVLVENSILYGASNSLASVLSCSVELGHSTVKNLATGTVTCADPRFVGGAGDPYRLQPSSPCIDAGSDPEVSGSLDVNGQPRSVSKLAGANKVDQGAYELP